MENYLIIKTIIPNDIIQKICYNITKLIFVCYERKRKRKKSERTCFVIHAKEYLGGRVGVGEEQKQRHPTTWRHKMS
jgi:hypothetical protein